MTAILTKVRDQIRNAHRIAVLSGAGISAASGIPTFRDALTGLWARYDPLQLATEEGFRADPALVWRWYAWRRELVAEALPNAGHRALAAAASRYESLTVITQNVDGLHRRAGSTDLIELHGTLEATICLASCGFRCDRPGELPAGEPPRCPRCGDWLRPAVVWFGESLDPRDLDRAEQAASACDLMLVVGTSGQVQPAAGLADVARRAGAAVVVVNTEPSALDPGATVLRGPAAELLPGLFEV